MPEIAELPDSEIGGIDAGFFQVAPERLAAIGVLEAVHQLREPIDECFVEAQHLANLSRRAAAAIGNDVGGHRRAQLAVALVDVLDHLLAAIAARQIEIDVGPFATLLRKEALEQQVHLDRIDCRDAQAVTDGAIGRRATALNENAVLPAEVDEIPDDQEVAGKIEFFDQIQFAGDLGAGTIVKRPIAIARADGRDPPQEGDHRLAWRYWISGKR